MKIVCKLFANEDILMYYCSAIQNDLPMSDYNKVRWFIPESVWEQLPVKVAREICLRNQNSHRAMSQMYMFGATINELKHGSIFSTENYGRFYRFDGEQKDIKHFMKILPEDFGQWMNKWKESVGGVNSLTAKSKQNEDQQLLFSQNV